MEKDNSSLSIKTNTKSIDDATKTLDNFNKKLVSTAKAINGITNSLAVVTNKFSKMNTKVNVANQTVNKYNTAINTNQQKQPNTKDRQEMLAKALQELQGNINKTKTENYIQEATLGMSSKNAKRQAQWIQLEQKEANLKEGVEDQSQINEITNKYLEAKQELQKSWELEDKNQGDWFAGLKVGIQDYLDTSQNLFSIANNFAQNSMEKLTGMILTFVNTGKANFKDFARSIITNIIEIIQKLVIFQAFQSVFKWMNKGAYNGGYIDGYALGGSVGYSDKPGGFTGRGNKYQPAGIVHKGEFVFTKEATKRLGVTNLYTLMNGAQKGYADGGYVNVGNTAPMSFTHQSDKSSSGINVTTNVAVNMASGGNSELSGANIEPKKLETQMTAIIQQRVNETVKKLVLPGGDIYNLMRAR